MSIQTDDNSAGLDEAAAIAALMDSMGGPKAPSNKSDDDEDEDLEAPEGDEGDDEDQGETQDDDDDANKDDEDDEGSEEEEGEAKAATPEINDDHELTVQVNGEDHTVTIGSLKRLAGQEATLTRKSQEAELVGARAAAALQAAIATVGEDLEPYATVDWMVLQNEMDPAEFKWHRDNAARLHDKYQKLVGAAQGVETTFNERKQSIDREAAAAAVAELKADIPDWSEKVYTDILAYGAKEGLDAEELATVTNPKVIKLIRKAMLHDQAKAVATKKVAAAPAKVIKGNKSGQTAKTSQSAEKAMKHLAATGSTDAAVAALLGRWG